MERRKFSALTSAALIAAPFLKLDASPVLYGDSVHDDAPALNAWLRGEDIAWADGSPIGDIIIGKRFFCRGTVFNGTCDGRTAPRLIQNCEFNFAPDVTCGLLFT